MFSLTILRLTDGESDAAAAFGTGLFAVTIGLEIVASLLNKKAGEMKDERLSGMQSCGYFCPTCRHLSFRRLRQCILKDSLITRSLEHCVLKNINMRAYGYAGTARRACNDLLVAPDEYVDCRS